MQTEPRGSVIHTVEEEVVEQELAVASQWQLMWRSFKKHRLAMASAAVIALMYLVVLFADFFAPYGPVQRFSGALYAPPQMVRFVDESGFSFRPFVYAQKQELDLATFQRRYVQDRSVKQPIYFFVRGPEYKLWGLIPSNLHLFGTADGKPIFLFGTDELGRDMLSRIIFGGRISLSIGLVGVFLSLVLGLFFGGISGYFGGTIDMIVQRTIEVIRSFPQIPLWMALSAALPQTWSPIQVYFAITVILSIIGWTGLARVARGKIMSLKNEDFVVAARLSGLKNGRIISRHLVPSFASHIIADVTLAIPQMILAETSLSFLGIGLRPPVISWGVLLQKAQNVHTIAAAPWLMIPGLFVILFVLAFNFLGDGLRDAADPYAQ